MMKRSKGSYALISTSIFCFAAGGLSCVGLAFKKHKRAAVSAAAATTAIGAAALVVNAFLHPEGIQIPDVPDIKVPTVNMQY